MKKEVAKKNIPVKDLLFRKFKKAIGIKVFILKYNDDKERAIYDKILFVLKEKNYLNYLIHKSNIQIFLTDIGRRLVDKQEHWEID